MDTGSDLQIGLHHVSELRLLLGQQLISVLDQLKSLLGQELGLQSRFGLIDQARIGADTINICTVIIYQRIHVFNNTLTAVAAYRVLCSLLGSLFSISTTCDTRGR